MAGNVFTQADCSAFASLPLVGQATQRVLGQDMLLAAGVDYLPYIECVSHRPSAKRVLADRVAVIPQAQR